MRKYKLLVLPHIYIELYTTRNYRANGYYGSAVSVQFLMLFYVKWQNNSSAQQRTTYGDTKKESNSFAQTAQGQHKQKPQCRSTHCQLSLVPIALQNTTLQLLINVVDFHWKGFYIAAPKLLSKKLTDFDWLVPSCPLTEKLRWQLASSPWRTALFFLFFTTSKKNHAHTQDLHMDGSSLMSEGLKFEGYS